MIDPMKKPYIENETRTIPRLFVESARERASRTAYLHRGGGEAFQATGYGELLRMVEGFSVGLSVLGLAGGRMFCISDNRPELAASILASMASGGMDAEKENAFPASELSRIVGIYDPDFLVLDNQESYRKYLSIDSLRGKKLIVMDPAGIDDGAAFTTFREVVEIGRRRLESEQGAFEKLLSSAKPEDPVTTVFTSGTTGTPKGVVLTQGNLTFAVCEFAHRIRLDDGESYLSVINMRHIGEKFAVFMGLTHGYRIILSSVKNLLADMAAERPEVLAGSPVMWKAFRDAVYRSIEVKGAMGLFEFLYGRSLAFIRARRTLSGVSVDEGRGARPNAFGASLRIIANLPFRVLANALFFRKVRAMTGGRVRVMVSGGALLHDELDDFFEAAGLELINGYGSNETTAVVTVRDLGRNVRHTIGSMAPRTEYRIVDPESRKDRPRGEPGVLLVRGPQVFKEYLGDPRATAAAKDSGGWFYTGDIVKELDGGQFAFVGRSKDPISLLARNNVEPEPIEERLEGSPSIKNAVVIGQDRPRLVALIAPNFDNVRSTLRLDSSLVPGELCAREDVRTLIAGEINREIRPGNGFMEHELVAAFELLPDQWLPGDLLTTTMKKRRGPIAERYSAEIESLYASTAHKDLRL